METQRTTEYRLGRQLEIQSELTIACKWILEETYHQALKILKPGDL